MTLVLHHPPDFYELLLNREGHLTNVVRYRHGINGHGEMLDINKLPEPLQDAIIWKLEHHHSQKTHRTPRPLRRFS